MTPNLGKNSGKCSRCKQKLPKKEFMTCSKCRMLYDLDCANVSVQRFYNTMTNEHKKLWKCDICQKKKRNEILKNELDVSVISPIEPIKIAETLTPEQTNNITQRTNKNTAKSQKEISFEQEASIYHENEEETVPLPN